MPSIYASGFVPSDLSLDEVERANDGAAFIKSSGAKNKRILLLSNTKKLNTNTSSGGKHSTRRKRTKNRKEVSTSNMITHNGIEYQINNAATYGVYLNILNRALDQLDVCISKWKRVFVIRFDLHQKYHAPDNKMVSKFRKNLARRIERQYESFEMGYAWCREQEKAKGQHYHVALYLDGDKVNHSSRISKMIRETWEALKVGNTVHIPKNCYYNITDNESKREVVYRISYLSKQRGKGYRPPQTKDYGTSRLSVPPCYNFNTGEKVK